MSIKVATSIKDYFKSFTIEPTVVFNILGLSILLGAQILTDLMIWKICNIELEYSEDICANLSLEINEDAENDVQRKLQEFQTTQQWIQSAPTFVYSFFMGSLTDKFGRKPAILLPLLGMCIATCLQFINVK